MKVSVRFTAAVHTLLCIHFFEGAERVTSEFISGSTGVNAVIIRKVLLQLQKAGLVETAPGVGGSHLARPADKITLLDVYKAINDNDEERIVFSFHPEPNPLCPVGRNIHRLLDPALNSAQMALEMELEKTTLKGLAAQLKTAPESSGRKHEPSRAQTIPDKVSIGGKSQVQRHDHPRGRRRTEDPATFLDERAGGRPRKR